MNLDSLLPDETLIPTIRYSDLAIHKFRISRSAWLAAGSGTVAVAGSSMSLTW